MSEAKVKEEKPKFLVMKTAAANEMIITVEGAEGRLFRFSSPFSAPLTECYNAGINVINEIARIFHEDVEKAKKIAEKEAEKDK